MCAGMVVSIKRFHADLVVSPRALASRILDNSSTHRLRRSAMAHPHTPVSCCALHGPPRLLLNLVSVGLGAHSQKTGAERTARPTQPRYSRLDEAMNDDPIPTCGPTAAISSNHPFYCHE